jgi:hypothetical protein
VDERNRLVALSRQTGPWWASNEGGHRLSVFSSPSFRAA